MYRQLAQNNNSVLLVDPHDELCSDLVCSAYGESIDLILYSDASPHFTVDSKLLLTEFWVRQLNKMQH